MRHGAGAPPGSQHPTGSAPGSWSTFKGSHSPATLESTRLALSGSGSVLAALTQPSPQSATGAT